MTTTTKPVLEIGVFDSKSWIYNGVRITKSKRGYQFRTRSTNGYGIGYAGDTYKTLSETATAIDGLVNRQDVTVELSAIVFGN
jgi:hypothetical protein